MKNSICHLEGCSRKSLVTDDLCFKHWLDRRLSQAWPGWEQDD